MSRIWVLETHTKGTGANIVPLDDRPESAAPRREPQFAVPKPRPHAPEAPAAKRPARFKVVDVMTSQVLAEDAGARATVDLLRAVRSVVDVRVYAWNHRDEAWRLLTQREQKMLWDLRGTAAAAAAAAGAPPV
ncbi:MAG: hypothetical protein QOH46_1970 [Solirubrobacteraceae bacterium]|jgi:hypothetical protein|nr:hypothetical protein [Solirubrobacteraceae bacterium]